MYLQLLACLIISIITVSYFLSKWIRLFLGIIFSFFITLQIISVKLTENFIGYKFIEHVNLKDIYSLKAFYISEILIGIVLFIILLAIILYTSFKLKKTNLSKLIPVLLTIILCLILIYVPANSILKNAISIYKIKNTETNSFEVSLSKLNIDVETYVKANEIKASPGKNIIVISLESLEKGFLQPPLERLTPNLNELSESNSFFDMQENDGSDWTAASIYTSITGIPAYFKTPKDELLQNNTPSTIGNLGAVLKSAGYKTTYFLARKDFSGLDDMLTTFGFDVKSEVDLNLKEQTGYWGLQDKELFEEATKHIVSQSKSEKPFAVFMNTISGHFPEGVYDMRLEDQFAPQRTKLEFMTYAVDYFVGELFKTLKQEKLLESTVVYIYPDHKFMSDINKVIPDFPVERDLYLISTASEEELKFDTSKKLSQIDIPRIIINGAGIKTNAVFLSDYIPQEEKHNFIVNNTRNFLSLNESSFKSYDFKDGITLRITGENQVTVSQKDGYKKVINDISEKALYRINFDHKMHFLKYQEENRSRAFWRGENAAIIFSIIDNEMIAYLFKNQNLGVAKENATEIIFTKDDINIFDNWPNLQPTKEFKPRMLNIKSVGYNSLIKRGHSFINANLKEYPINRGMNIFLKKDSIYTIEHFDTYESEMAAAKFLNRVEEIRKQNIQFILLAHDDASKKLKPYADKLKEMRLQKLSELNYGEAYVAYLSDMGIYIEETDDYSVSIELPLWIMNKKI